jgi:hypothetical protein
MAHGAANKNVVAFTANNILDRDERIDAIASIRNIIKRKK